MRFFAHLWRSARQPAVCRRCARIALVVGCLPSAVNQGDALLAGRLDVGLRIVATFLIPFVVANLGAMGAQRGGGHGDR